MDLNYTNQSIQRLSNNRLGGVKFEQSDQANLNSGSKVNSNTQTSPIQNISQTGYDNL